MFIQEFNPDLELRFFFDYIIIILALELWIYSMIQFFRRRHEELHYNRILVSYAMFFFLFLLGFGTDMIARSIILTGRDSFRISRSFTITFELLSIIYNGIFLISPTVFFIFVIGKEFSEILNLRFIKIFILFDIASTILLLGLSSIFISFITTIRIISSILSLYILYFQDKLIKSSSGKIRERFSIIFIGEIFITLGIIINSFFTVDLYQTENITPLIFIRTMIFIPGFIIIIVRLYDFPPFYEFKWKDNLISLFIIVQNNNKCVYSYSFSPSRDGPIEHHRVLSEGITSIESMMSTIMKKKDKLMEIKQAEFFMMLDYGELESTSLIYILNVKKTTRTNKIFLNKIKTQFESFYNEILTSMTQIEEREEQLFLSFDDEIKKLMY